MRQDLEGFSDFSRERSEEGIISGMFAYDVYNVEEKIKQVTKNEI